MKIDSRTGFTLIEMLAALFITGLFILVAMPFITQLVAHAWSGEANMAMADEWMRADARLAADISEAIPLSKGNGDNTLVFAVTPDHVKFVRTRLTGDRTRLDLVTLVIEQGSSGDNLLRRARPYDHRSSDDDADEELSSNVVLLTTSCSMRFTTPGGLSDEDIPVKELPSAIMLEIDNCGSLTSSSICFSDTSSQQSGPDLQHGAAALKKTSILRF